MISGDQIRMVRMRRHLSQTKFGQSIGVSKTTVTDWENGKSKISEENEAKLFELYGDELRLPVSVGPQSSKRKR